MPKTDTRPGQQQWRGDHGRPSRPAPLWCSKKPGQRGRAATGAEALRDGGLQVDLQSPTAVPTRPEQLDRYDGIALANVAATQLTLDQQRTIQRFVPGFRAWPVRGGRQYQFCSRGLRWQRARRDAAHVSPTPPPRRDDGSIALFLVIDKSGSMDLYRSDVSKMAMAREAAIRSVEALRPNDTLGVIAFDNRVQWAIPPVKITKPGDLTDAQTAIGRIRADGGTSIYPALEEAYKAAAASDARLKHIILLTDGQSFDRRLSQPDRQDAGGPDHPLDDRGGQRL